MATLCAENDELFIVTAEFVHACGLLRDMNDVFGALDEPVPLRSIPAEALRDAIFYHQQFCSAQCEQTPEGQVAFLQSKTALQTLALWRVADYLDFAPLQHILTDSLADLIGEAGPGDLLAMFCITEMPSEAALSTVLQQYPELRE